MLSEILAIIFRYPINAITIVTKPNCTSFLCLTLTSSKSSSIIIDTGLDPAEQQYDDSESTSYVSLFSMHYANQPIVIPNLGTLKIDKRLRSNGTGAFGRTKEYGESFLSVTPPSTADLAIVNKGKFMAYNSILRKDYAIKIRCGSVIRQSGHASKKKLVDLLLVTVRLAFQRAQADKVSMKETPSAFIDSHSAIRSMQRMCLMQKRK